MLVLQGRPGWSAARWDEPREVWSGELLAAARELCGDQVARPAGTDVQRWRFARLTGGDAWTAPLLLPAGGDCRIGIAGEAAASGGGVQAAWRSGRMLADRLIEQPSGET